MDQLYFESGYLAEGYYTVTREAESHITVQINIVVIAQTFEGVDLFAFANAAIAVQVTRIRSTDITASAVFNVATDFVVTRSADSDIDAVISAIVNGLRSRDVNSTTQAAFSFAAQVEATKSATANVTAQSTISCSAINLEGTDIVANNFATVSCTANLIRSFTTQLNVISQQIALANFNVISSANLLSHASIFVSRNAHPRIPIVIDGFPDTSADGAKFGLRSNRIFGSPTKTLSYPNQLRIYTNTQFVLQGWHQGPITEAQIFFIGVSGTSDVSNVGNNQIVVNVRLEQLNQQARYKFYLLTKNSSNQSVVFQSAFYSTEGAHPDLLPLPYIRSSLNQLSGSAWNHLALTKDSNNLVSFLINGVTVVSGTVSTIGTASEYRVGWSGVVTAQYKYWDELSLRKGTSGITFDAVQNDPATQAFLYHFEESQDLGFVLPQDDISTLPIAHFGSAGITSVSSVSATVGFITNGQSNLSVSSSVTAIVGELKDINLVAFDDIEVTTTAERIRFTQSSLTTSVSMVVVANKTTETTATITGVSNVNVDASRIRSNFLFSLDLVSTVVSAGDRLKGVIQNLSSAFITTNFYLEDGYIESGYYEQFETVAVKTARGTAALVVVSVFSASARTDVNAALVAQSSSSVTATVIKTASASINQSAQSSVNTIGVVIRNAVIITQAVSSQLSAVVRLAGLFADDLSEFNLTTVGSRTASAQSSLESQSQITVTAFKIKQLSSVLQSSATMSTNALKAVGSTSSLTSQVTQASAVSKIAVYNSALSSVSSVVVLGNLIGKNEVNAFSTTSLNAVVVVTRSATCSISSQASVIANTANSRNRQSSAALTLVATQSAVAAKQVNPTFNFESIAISLSVVVKAATGAIELSSAFSVSVNVEVSRGTGAALITSATTVVTANRIARITLAIISQSTQTATAQRVFNASISTQSVASTLSAVVKIAKFFINCESVSTVVASGQIITLATSSLTSAATFTSTPIKQVRTTAAFINTSSLGATVGLRKSVSAAITSALTFVVAVRELRLDAIVYVIPAEGWTYRIEGETRLHTILSESRVKEIVGETRLHTINGESRIHII